MKYNPKTHHRRSIRLQQYDYSQEGMYYVTICIEDRECLLGEVAGGEIILSAFGEVVREEWIRTTLLRREVILDEFVIMPNHFHGIIFLRWGTSRRAPTREAFGKPTKDSIPTIIRLFKSSVTKRVNELRGTPGNSFWQRGYYEHVIRDGKDLDRIRRYILANPANWSSDETIPGISGWNGYTKGKRTGRRWSDVSIRASEIRSKAFSAKID
jgi:putative transposase